MASEPTTTSVTSDAGNPQIPVQLQDLWTQALATFKISTSVNLNDHPLFKKFSPDLPVEDIIEVFEELQTKFNAYRGSQAKWGIIRDKYLKPMVSVVLVLNKLGGDTLGSTSLVPGGKAIFAAIGTLLEATKAVSERYEALLELLEKIHAVLNDLSLYKDCPQAMNKTLQTIIVSIFAHLLDVLALALRLIGKAKDDLRGVGGLLKKFFVRSKHYVQDLMGSDDMRAALERLTEIQRVEQYATTRKVNVDVARNIEISTKLWKAMLDTRSVYTDSLRELLDFLQEEARSAQEERERAAEERQKAEIERRRAEEERERHAVERKHQEEEREQAAKARQQEEEERKRQREAEARRREDDERKELFRLLDPLDEANLDAQDRPGCLEGTRLNLLQVLDEWADSTDPKPIYWLHGMAGTGKSAIARSFGRNVRKKNQLGGTFFCSRESIAPLTDGKRILPNVVYGLAMHNPTFRQRLHIILRKYLSQPRPVTWELSLQATFLLIEPFQLSPIELKSLSPSIDTVINDSCSDGNKDSETTLSPPIVSRPVVIIDALDESQDTTITAFLQALVPYVKYRLAALPDGLKGTITLATDWVSPEEVQSVAQLARQLFIHAFTTTEYIRAGYLHPRTCLGHVLKFGRAGGDESTATPLEDLDRIYKFVLEAAAAKNKGVQLIRRILAAIVIQMEPLTIGSFSKLLRISVDDLRFAVAKLHAVLHVPEADDHDSLATLHASFGDFLTDQARAPPEWLVSREEGHADIAAGCFAVMSSSDLHFNMSRARTSYLGYWQELLPVPEAVEYACYFILDHMSRTPPGSALTGLYNDLEITLIPKFFFWLEVKSRFVVGIDDRERWSLLLAAASANGASRRCEQFLKEVYELLLKGALFTESGPHAYLSVIPFLEPNSLLAIESARDFDLARFPRVQAHATDLMIDFSRGVKRIRTVFTPLGHCLVQMGGETV